MLIDFPSIRLRKPRRCSILYSWLIYPEILFLADASGKPGRKSSKQPLCAMCVIRLLIVAATDRISEAPVPKQGYNAGLPLKFLQFCSILNRLAKS
jgi:hypothetical protein